METSQTVNSLKKIQGFEPEEFPQDNFLKSRIICLALHDPMGFYESLKEYGVQSENDLVLFVKNTLKHRKKYENDFSKKVWNDLKEIKNLKLTAK